jgi:integrase
VQRVYIIGEHGKTGPDGKPWTPDRAHAFARQAAGRIAAGEDPSLAKREAREALTVAELIDSYLTEGPATKPKKRASTWEIDGSNLNRHIRPLIGRKVADTITKAEAARAIRDIATGRTATEPRKSGKARGRIAVKGGEGVARRTRTTAAAMFAWGLEHGLIKGTNPFAAVELGAAPKRERFLSREEAGKLLDAITALEAEGDHNPAMWDAVRLLLLTGARKTEIAALRWREVDFGRSRLVLPPERTKAGGDTGERYVTLTAPALAILARRRADDTRPEGFVFQSTRANAKGEALPVVGLRRPYMKALKAAGIEGARLHDLRHTFASFVILDTGSLYLASKLLGHANARTTERYAHLAADPLQAAADAVGRKLMPAAYVDEAEGDEARPAAEIIPIRQGA